jgi:probable dihydroxyacetone kinase regulator
MPESMITKRALADAIKLLMEQEPLTKITVGDICQKCGMSRKGFYYHFKDKYDLVNWIFYTDFIIRVKQANYADIWEFLDDICSYFYENRKFYINAFQVEGQNSFTEYFNQIMQPLTEDYLYQVFDAEPDDMSRFYSVFFTDAFRISIMRWLKEETQISPAEFVGLLRHAVSGIAQKYADPPAR